MAATVPGGAYRSLVASKLDDGERIHPVAVEEWRAWLHANHTRTEGVWLVGWRRRANRPSVPYEEAVEEALCVGWIDSVARTLDDDRSMQWFAPRKRGSVWASSNKERVERLEREGRMTDAGRAVVERAKADGTWSLLEPAERLEVPGDLAVALGALPGAREKWEASTPSSRRMALGDILLAKRPETRAKRIAAVADRVARGDKPAG